MKELRILVSPFYSEDVYVDPVTGSEYKKSEGVYGINLSEDKLAGIKEGLRKNFLIPFDRQTLEFIKEGGLPSTPSVAPAMKEVKVEAPVEEPKAENTLVEESEEAVEEAPVAKKAARKRAPKKNVSEE